MFNKKALADFTSNTRGPAEQKNNATSNPHTREFNRELVRNR